MARAGCPYSTSHEPPAPDCLCGLYADENLIDAVCRMRAHAISARAGVAAARPGRIMAAGMVPVLAKAALERPRAERNYRRIPPAGKVFTVHELRGSAAAIQHLYVAEDYCPHWLLGHRFMCRHCPDSKRIAEALSHAFGVPATAGLPRYSHSDWVARPTWHSNVSWTAANGRWAMAHQVDPRAPLTLWTATIPEPGQSVDGEAITCELYDFVNPDPHTEDAILDEFAAALRDLRVDKDSGLAPHYTYPDFHPIDKLCCDVQAITAELPEGDLLRRIVDLTADLGGTLLPGRADDTIVSKWLNARGELLRMHDVQSADRR